ncbi:hypothetical protein [Novosphingobium resinovorum]|uniref:hypothetical protein n=1 Tax=Novosphingobium resinovorum TaxID=158500 RepID=UPI00363CBEFA
MAGADDGYFPKPEKKNPVFGSGKQGSPYFEEDGDASASAAFGATAQQLQLEEDVRLPGWKATTRVMRKSAPASGRACCWARSASSRWWSSAAAWSGRSRAVPSNRWSQTAA